VRTERAEREEITERAERRDERERERAENFGTMQRRRNQRAGAARESRARWQGGRGDRVMTRRETAGEGEYVPAQRLRTPWRWPPGPCTPVDRPRRPQLRIDLGSLSHP
jgi:hypothetical protein